jgi:hypothetical protein
VYVYSCNLCRPSQPPGGKRQEACTKTSKTVTCYQPSQRERWRDTDWFKQASQTKLGNDLDKSRVAPVFAVPRQFDRKGFGSTRFSSLWVGRRPMHNLEIERGRRLVGRCCVNGLRLGAWRRDLLGVFISRPMYRYAPRSPSRLVFRRACPISSRSSCPPPAHPGKRSCPPLCP